MTLRFFRLGLLPWTLTFIFFALMAHPGARADELPSLTERQKTVHVLNRLGFGPRPGDVERVESMGLERYIRQQLHPETIDDSAVEAALAPFDTLQMSSGHLMEEYYGDIRRYIDQQRKTGDPAEMRLRFGIDIRKNNAAPATVPAGPPPKPPYDVDELIQRDALRCVGELQDAKLIRAVLSQRQLNEVMTDFWENHFNIDIKKDMCRALKVADDRDAIRPLVLGRFRDLLGASAHSPAMLLYLDNNENSVVRERGPLEKKLVAMYVTAKFGIDASGIMSAREGPNENYGREILELHTLGVDGGYTQKDVQEVARCFTGWTMNPINGKFQFTENRHDQGPKIVLGVRIPPGGGASDGEKVLDILAAHPSTAKFICRKLCQRLVCDEPPAELVERAARIFRLSDGDIRKVVQTIVGNPEFYSMKTYRSKIKSPFEYAVSAVRATGGSFIVPSLAKWQKLRHVQEGAGVIGYGSESLSGARRKSLNWSIFDMGEPLFDCAPPTGYTENSSRWISPGALIDRLNFALALTQNDVSDVKFNVADLVKEMDSDEPAVLLSRLSAELLHGELGETTRKTLLLHGVAKDGRSKPPDAEKLTALLLGSPDFQRH